MYKDNWTGWHLEANCVITHDGQTSHVTLGGAYVCRRSQSRYSIADDFLSFSSFLVAFLSRTSLLSMVSITTFIVRVLVVWSFPLGPTTLYCNTLQTSLVKHQWLHRKVSLNSLLWASCLGLWNTVDNNVLLPLVDLHLFGLVLLYVQLLELSLRLVYSGWCTGDLLTDSVVKFFHHHRTFLWILYIFLV